MRYKVVTTWTVEVTDAEVEKAAKGYGQSVDPKQLAVFKAIMKAIEVTTGTSTWDELIDAHFDVTPYVN